MEKVVSIEKIIETFDLEILTDGSEFDKEIVLSAVHKPGAELTGFIFDDITEVDNSIHILGIEEIRYLNSLTKREMSSNMDGYFSHNFPCVIVTAGLEVDEYFLELSEKYSKPILSTSTPQDVFLKELRKFLEKELAPELVVNKFVFLECFGLGILLTGYREAVIGTAVELLEKGHRFITDGLLNIKKIGENRIFGENAYNTNKKNEAYYLKLGENEKINVAEYFGIGSTRRSKEIDLLVKLEKWDNKKFYDRLGVDSSYQFILGVEVEKLMIPVRKGRNLAIIIETAAMNIRMKKNGQNSALYFLEETQKLIQENRKKRIGDNEMGFIKALTIDELIDEFNLNVLAGEDNLSEKYILQPNIHRPSLEFSGFYEVLEEGGKDKIQLISSAEFKYLERLNEAHRKTILVNYLDYNFPCILITGVKDIPEYFIRKAEERGQVVLSTPKNLSTIFINLIEFLEIYFAPNITLHGVMIEVYGFGVLLKGKSGIGKSETALELIHRGHRLIADDMVKLTKFPDGRVIGKADKVPHFMEIRGLGIIDIKTLYGLGSVRRSKKLDVIIELKEMSEEDYLTKADYTESEITILDNKFTKVDLYISSGRNAASMVEIATMKLRAKKLGYDSETEYKERTELLSEIERREMEKNIMKIGKSN